ncbi:hypothetical protein QC761_507900 [Podospora bellae-mahoneyi]|uniref:SnoaL-like domain-containing protein n=1 Tax=Podospora bellae-mahoneyi TaxID=2093777 RepID=A0ABR0FFY1_9PEZI|nr:hypothetical protein QC761_507900 [Podospora bellae-mahoneyi]
MGRAIYRPRKTAGIASHGKSELGDLIDMYHTRQATLVHDKVFALLGMSTTDPLHKTFLDYWAGWDVVFKQVEKSLFGALVSVDTWSHSQVAEIQGNGQVLGKVIRVEFDDANGRQKLSIEWKVSQAQRFYIVRRLDASTFCQISPEG